MSLTGSNQLCAVGWHERIAILRLISDDETNRLSIARVQALTNAVAELANTSPAKLIVTGNTHFFSAGADLHEIATLTGAQAFKFARMGQQLMSAVAEFPAPTIAAINGYCMGGGLDLHLLAIAAFPVRTRYSVIAAQLSDLLPGGVEPNAFRASSGRHVRCRCSSSPKS